MLTCSDGSIQATYDGHPLSIYVGDSAPRTGQRQRAQPERRPVARGNRVRQPGPSNADINSPIAIGSWLVNAISGAVVLVQPEKRSFATFKLPSISLILLCVLAISCIRD